MGYFGHNEDDYGGHDDAARLRWERERLNKEAAVEAAHGTLARECEALFRAEMASHGFSVAQFCFPRVLPYAFAWGSTPRTTRLTKDKSVVCGEPQAHMLINVTKDRIHDNGWQIRAAWCSWSEKETGLYLQGKKNTMSSVYGENGKQAILQAWRAVKALLEQRAKEANNG
jgi:hypothetical protein